jgi:YggT family protein
MPIVISLLQVVHAILGLYVWVVIIWVILSWLINFNIVNTHSPAVRMIERMLGQLVDPALNRIRRFIPVMGGLDLSPLVLIFAIYFIQLVLEKYIVRFL